MHYNFARIHQTTRVTPALAAGVTDKLWDMTDIVRVIEAYESGEVPQILIGSLVVRSALGHKQRQRIPTIEGEP